MVTDGPGDVITGRGRQRGDGVGRSGCGLGAQGGGVEERERGNAPNHDNFSSPQLLCSVRLGGGMCTPSLVLGKERGRET